MIKLLRLVLSVLSLGLLMLGYLASQVAAMQGNALAYAEKVDAAPIRIIALIVLLAAIGSCFLPSEEPTP
jgi:hypothetical protein